MNGKRDKAQKKIARCLAILQRDLPDIQPSETPTKFLFIGNAGLTTNADESSLVELIRRTGTSVEAIMLLPGKQYSFACFASEDQAKQAFESAHGQMDTPGASSPVYMAYVDKVPPKPAQQHTPPPGLQIVENFISEDEEKMLLNLIDWGEKPGDKAEGSLLKHRQVRHFGYEFKYGSNSVDKDNPLPIGIPEPLNGIVRRIVEQGWMPLPPDQLTINRYLPGQGIPPHVDTHRSFTDEILSLSTGGGVMMDFRHGVSDKQQQHTIYLPSRSLCVMAGPARYEWTHGICPRMTDVVSGRNGIAGLHLCPRQERVSFTFRKVREGECLCGNRRVCDSAMQNSGYNADSGATSADFISDDIQAMRLEQQHVLQVYDQIAGHFSATRHKPWPNVLEFVTSLPLGAALLDVGCGNGKYLGHNEKIFQMGCDTSYELVKICNTRGFEVLTSNCLQLPFRDSTFDAVICIAVIHHLATVERRLASLKEMARVLRIGGKGLVYVWAMEQQRGKKKSAYLKQNKANQKQEENGENVGANAACDIDIKSGKSDDISSGLKKEVMQESPKSCALQDVPLPVHVNRTEFVQQDMLVPWKLKPQIKKDAKEKGKNKKYDNRSNQKSDSDKSSDGVSQNLDKDDQPSKLVESEQANSNMAASDSCETTVEGQEPVFHRYYHVFKQGELEALCGKIEGLKVVKSYYDEGNWCVIFEKSD
ncbi:alkylated DNA repair protein alkB homolog 8-like [Penaeus indicus]|uniref:alkylated DNA repair protein alkB homolog 8-like n=1 Tax=Penaeus indicus TaxID=29960 RepID=UPI00300CC895